MIYNHATDDYYIGSTSVSFKRRESSHVCTLGKQCHRNIHLQRAYDLYGHFNFTFSILEIVDDNSKIIQREQWYLDNWNPRYNIAKIAECSAKGMKLSPEHIEKIRRNMLGKPAWNKGVPFSKETRERMSKAKKGIVYKRTKEVKKKKVIREDGVIYNSTKHAAMEMNLKINTIIMAITSLGKRRAKGYRFKYLDDTHSFEPLSDQMSILSGVIKLNLGTRYIQQNGNRYVVRIRNKVFKDVYLGRYKELEEAIKIRDEFLNKNYFIKNS